jgi:hypothetical protein
MFPRLLFCHKIGGGDDLKNSIRIYNRRRGYSVKDCACNYCLWYSGIKRDCALAECACAEERAEAEQRERDTRHIAQAYEDIA